MLDTSLPTLLAYAPWSLLSLVLRLILKNTSSPVELTTYTASTTPISNLHVSARRHISHLDVDGGIGILLLDLLLGMVSVIRHYGDQKACCLCVLKIAEWRVDWCVRGVQQCAAGDDGCEKGERMQTRTLEASLPELSQQLRNAMRPTGRWADGEAPLLKGISEQMKRVIIVWKTLYYQMYLELGVGRAPCINCGPRPHCCDWAADVISFPFYLHLTKRLKVRISVENHGHTPEPLHSILTDQKVDVCQRKHSGSRSVHSSDLEAHKGSRGQGECSSHSLGTS